MHSAASAVRSAQDVMEGWEFVFSTSMTWEIYSNLISALDISKIARLTHSLHVKAWWPNAPRFLHPSQKKRASLASRILAVAVFGSIPRRSTNASALALPAKLNRKSNFGPMHLKWERRSFKPIKSSSQEAQTKTFTARSKFSCENSSLA